MEIFIVRIYRKTPASAREIAGRVEPVGSRGRIAGALLVVALITLSSWNASGYEITQSVIAGGGGGSGNGAFALSGTIGQDITATSSGAGYIVNSGFWPGGANAGTVLTLDVDLNGSADAATDGLLILRYLFGLGGPSLTDGAVAPNAVLKTPQQIAQRLSDILPILDADANGQVDALTDGLLFLRYLSGLRGDSLIAGIVAPNATRTSAAAIESYIQSLLP